MSQWDGYEDDYGQDDDFSSSNERTWNEDQEAWEGSTGDFYMSRDDGDSFLNNNDSSFNSYHSTSNYSKQSSGTTDYSNQTENSQGETANLDCFVITATMGDASHPVVQEFRYFRDNELIKSSIGRVFISIYYKIGPTLAKPIKHIDLLRSLSLKCMVEPLYRIIKRK